METMFSNFQEVFRWFLQNYTDFGHKISHIKPSKYDSTFGIKISIYLKKVRGMRLWIGTSTCKENIVKPMKWVEKWQLWMRLTNNFASVNFGPWNSPQGCAPRDIPGFHSKMFRFYTMPSNNWCAVINL